MISKIEKIGRLKTSVIITFTSLVLSQVITLGVYKITEGKISVSGGIASFASPLLITPFLSWWFIGLLLKINNLEKEMRILATYDTLTGAYNRNSFFPVCESILTLMRRDNSSLTLLYIDLDHFKTINDTFGHNVGDIVLKSVGTYLSESIRKSDFVGRIGGEEFVVCLPNTDVKNGLIIAEKIRNGISSLEVIYNTELRIRITASIGIACNLNFENSGIDELIKMADLALYQAKNEGRDRLVVNCSCGSEN